MSLSAKLLTLADGVMENSTGVMVSRWPRATAAVGRQAIEAALDEFWQANEPSMVGLRSKRAQLLSLQVYHPDIWLAREVSSAWAQLSRACHFHPYELPPTEVELRILLDVARRFASSVDQENRES